MRAKQRVKASMTIRQFNLSNPRQALTSKLMSEHEQSWAVFHNIPILNKEIYNYHHSLNNDTKPVKS